MEEVLSSRIMQVLELASAYVLVAIWMSGGLFCFHFHLVVPNQVLLELLALRLSLASMQGHQSHQ